MCVNNPPLFSNTGLNGLPNYVEVVLTQQQSTFFSFLSLASANVTINTRAIAGLKSFSDCMIALNQTGTDLTVGGGGNATNLSLNNCSFVSDSNDPQSLWFNGNVTVKVTGAPIDTLGGWVIKGKANSVSPVPTVIPDLVTDPYLNQITVPTLGTNPDTCANYSSGNNTLIPSAGTGGIGWYGCAGNPAITLGNGGTTTFCPGVYVLDGEKNGVAFLIQANSVGGTIVNMGVAGNTYNSVMCPSNGATGVTIIATCRTTGCSTGGGFVIGGNMNNAPTVTLSAPTTSPLTGIPQQILFYQVASTADTKFGNTTLAGGSGVSLNGVVYTPATQVQLQGNPTLGSCTEFIANTFQIGGTASMSQPPLSCGVLTQSTSTIVLAE
jgi:hypothetical protein